MIERPEYLYVPAGVVPIPPAGGIWDPGREVCDVPMYVVAYQITAAVTVCRNPRYESGFEISYWRRDSTHDRWRLDPASLWCPSEHEIEIALTALDAYQSRTS